MPTLAGEVPKSRQKKKPFSSPDRPLAIKWVLDSWDAIGMPILQAAMMKHVVEPALSQGPLPRRAQPSDPEPNIPENVDDHMEALDELVLPQEHLQDGSGVVEATGPDDEASSSSSAEGENRAAEEGRPQPEGCCKCQRPMREANRGQCPTCGLLFHPWCVSVSSHGKCQFCS